MIYTKEYSENERRALNIIWTASGDYCFKPDFMAFKQDGSPDFYLNSIIGFVHKWYDTDILTKLFTAIDESAMKNIFTDLLWLGLENCAYEKETAVRPCLSFLREQHARDFFEGELHVSLPQLMQRSSCVYDLHTARWRSVLGEKKTIADPWEAGLYKALSFDGNLTTQQIAVKTSEILRKYFIFRLHSGNSGPKTRHFSPGKTLLYLLEHILPAVAVSADNLPGIRRISRCSNRKQNLNPVLKFGSGRQEKIRMQIENIFGKPAYGPDDTAKIENQLCTGNHRDSHLYFTRGDAISCRKRTDSNLLYYRQHEDLYRNTIRKLVRSIMNCMAITRQPVQVKSDSGAFSAGSVWRSLYLHDDRVFRCRQEDVLPDFTVDIMLDASGSRTEEQEIIAAQGYTISRSLSDCRIPVQVYSFCTVKGFTVLTLLKTYTETGQDKNIFRYSASGWNRDGLALRGAGYLMGKRCGKRILVILTDAWPNDECMIPSSSVIPFGCDYTGKKAVDDTAAEVVNLRKQGIKVMAVISGGTAETAESAKCMYGKDFIKIREVGKFAEAVGMLLQKQIMEM